MAKLFLDLQTALVNGVVFTVTPGQWSRFFTDLVAKLNAIETIVNGTFGVNRWTLAAQPTLTASDEGYVAFVTDYGHLVRWTGTVWEFAPGDPGAGYFEDFAIVPQQVGWALCNGAATDYLTVGAAALSATAMTPPDLTGAYRKSAAAYTGAVAAASGSTAAGSTGTGTIPSFHTGDDTASVSNVLLAGGGATVLSLHPHDHVVGDLTVPSLTVAGLGVGTIDLAHLDVLTYFRR